MSAEAEPVKRSIRQPEGQRPGDTPVAPPPGTSIAELIGKPGATGLEHALSDPRIYTIPRDNQRQAPADLHEQPQQQLQSRDLPVADDSETLPPEDQAFLEMQKMKARIKPFDQEAFFRAASEFREHSETLREHLDVGFPTRPDPSSTDRATKEREISSFERSELKKPSRGRLVELSRHFLKIPQIKNQFDRWNAEKIKSALPEFQESLELLSADNALPAERSEYFEQVDNLMAEAMINIVDEYPASEVEDLGILMSYHGFKNLLAPNRRLVIVASSGIPTFTNYLRLVVEDAISNNEDLTTRINDEFLPGTPEGLGRRLMQVPLGPFIDRFKGVFTSGDFALAEQLLEQPGHTGGRCPSIMEQLVHQYAKVIVDNLPQRS